MALTAGISPARRGAPPAAGTFGGSVAASEKIWRGGLICWNAAGTLQRLQTSGSVGFAGLASKDYDNSATAAAAPVAMKSMSLRVGSTVDAFATIDPQILSVCQSGETGRSAAGVSR